MHKVISIKSTATDTVPSCLKVVVHPQQHFHAVDLILESEGNQLLNLMSPLAFDKIRHIEINVAEVSGIILFDVLYVIKIEQEFVSTVTVKHNVEGIINEISANYDLKDAVETVAESSHIELLIDFIKVPVIHVKLLLKLEPDAVRGQSVKESRQDNEPILMLLREQGGDVLTTGLVQQYSTHHVHERHFI